MLRLCILSIFLAIPLARAEGAMRAARDTADVQPKGAWSVGIFNPLRYAISDGLELEAAPLVFLTSPHATARIAHKTGDLRVTGEYGLGIPTFGMRLTQGYFFPTWAKEGGSIGWGVVPSAGVVVSGGDPKAAVWTGRADLAIGLPLTAHTATPLHSFLAPLDLLFAPLLNGYRARLGGAYDMPLGERLRVRGELNLFHVGADGNLVANGKDVGKLRELSRVYVTAHVGLDVALFEQSRFTIGCLVANYDQGAVAVSKGADGYAQVDRVRSWNILPTLDFIWAGG